MPNLLAETALKAAILLAASAVMVLLLRRSAARLRVAVWTAALGGILLLPLAASLLPGLPVHLPAPLALSLTSPTTPPAATPGPGADPGAGAAPGAAPPLAAAATSLPPGGTASVAAAAGTLGSPPPGADADGAGAFRPRPAALTWLLVLWLGGACLSLARLAADWRRVRALLARSRPAPAAWGPLLAAARRETGCRRPVRLRICPDLAVPATVGLRRPAILLPDAAAGWSGDRRALVLRHELVHVARLDWGARLLASLACAVHWFDPLAWWARRRLALEQELACDQEIVAGGVRPSSYAVHLLDIARGAARQPAAAVSVPEMARPTHLEERIMAILNGRTRRHGIAGTVAAALALLLVVPVLAAMEVAAPPAPDTAPPSREAALARPAAPAPAPAPAPEPPRSAPPAWPEPASAPRSAADEAEPAAPEPPAPAAEPAVRTASPELSRLIAEMRDLETQLEDQLEPLDHLEDRMRPHLEEIEALDIQIDEDALRELEREVEALSGQIEAIKPQIEAFAREMAQFGEEMSRDLDRSTLAELREHRVARAERIREVERRMRPHREAIRDLERQMAPLRERLAERTTELELVDRAELRRIEEAVRRIEPLTEGIEEIETEIQPLVGRIEGLAESMKRELAHEVEAILRQHLEPVTEGALPFAGTAAELVDAADVLIVHRDVLSLEIDRGTTSEMLGERFGPARRGSREAFREAVEAASQDLSHLEIRTGGR